MYTANQCTGFFIKPKCQEQQDQFKIFYFYVDTEGIMHFTHNLALINFLIKTSQNENEVDEFIKMNKIVNRLKSSAIVRISGIKQFPQVDNVPFWQRSCFEIQLTHNQAVELFIIFATIEEDIDLVQEYIRGGWQKRKQAIQLLNKQIDNQQVELDQKVELLAKLQGIFAYCQSLPVTVIQHQSTEDHQDEITYTGQTVDDLPDGTGTLFFKQQGTSIQDFIEKIGISFVGEFMKGKKHGRGYIVDSNLDMIYCEFINDELAGI